jgi:hypothetical protein
MVIYEMTICDAGRGPIILIDRDNTRHIFGQIADGGYVSHNSIYMDLVKNADEASKDKTNGISI